MKTIGLALLALCLSVCNHQNHHFARAVTCDGRLVVVQLGDSYSSGVGARDASGAVNYAGVPECFRSPTGWGAQATAALSRPTLYVNRACAGSVIADLTNPRLLNTRPTTKVIGVCSATPTLPFAPEEYYIDGNTSCPNALQSQFLGVTKETDVVLIVSGGNDFRFFSIVSACLALPISPIPRCQADINFVNANLDKFGSALTNALLAIKPLLNNQAIVVVVPYPHFVLNTPAALGEQELTNTLRNLGNAVEQSQQTAVAAANKNSTREFVIFYNGTKPLFEGHEPHPDFFVENPDRWLYEFEPSNRGEIYHLNPIGHAELGKAMATFLTPRLVPSAPSAITCPPTKAPTRRPTKAPTRRPTKAPTRAPTKAPTRAPTKAPTRAPTKAPTTTRTPTKAPTTARAPTKNPVATAPTKLRRCGGPLRCLFRKLFRCQC
jgi:GDSL-like Lipase/Acylhydrolase family